MTSGLWGILPNVAATRGPCPDVEDPLNDVAFLRQCLMKRAFDVGRSVPAMDRLILPLAAALCVVCIGVVCTRLLGNQSGYV